MKLIKINTDHYIIVDDSEIKEGDYHFDFDKNEIDTWKGNLYSNRLKCKKITHSTQPLSDECKNCTGYCEQCVDGTKPLSLSEVKELIGEVDVEKKAINSWEGCDGCDANDELFFTNGYQRGYNQALEDNKEKKYTEEDLRKAWDSGREYANDYWEARGEKYMINFDNFIQSLQPKTEWEVEFIDNKLKLL